MPFALARDAGGYVRLDPGGVHVRDAFERIDDGLALPAQLRIVGKAGPGTAPASAARGFGTKGLHALGRRLDEVLEPCAHEAIVCVHVLDLTLVTGKAPCDEGDAPIGKMAHAITAVRERFDGNCLGVHMGNYLRT